MAVTHSRGWEFSSYLVQEMECLNSPSLALKAWRISGELLIFNLKKLIVILVKAPHSNNNTPIQFNEPGQACTQ